MKEFKIKIPLVKILFPFIGFLLVVAPYFNQKLEKLSAALAVAIGILFTFIFQNPYIHVTKKITPKLLTWSVIGLGCGMNLNTVIQTGLTGMRITFLSIVFITFIGLLLGILLKNKRDTSVLIVFGTAICGGSAIAAIAPTIKAQNDEISLALAIVFLLNALSLFVFPIIGHYFHLTAEQFGLWCALAIHDTSSVIGATLQYGKEAVEIGTTIKLSRSIWIIPITFILSFIYTKFLFTKKSQDNLNKIKMPWFILLFLIAAAVVTWFPIFKTPGIFIRHIAERVLTLTLFFIGSNLTWKSIKNLGIKPFLQGLLLWMITASTILWWIK